MVKALNGIPETIKTIEENISRKISDIACSNILFWYISSGKGKKEKKNNGTTSN